MLNKCFAKFVTAVAVSLVTVPIVVDAQSTTKVRRIGYLATGSSNSGFQEQFRQGLRDLGWVEGQNIAIEYRFADGRFDRLPELAAELVRLKVDLIVAQPTPAALAARNATQTIPIVMINVGDPAGIGLVGQPRTTGRQCHGHCIRRRVGNDYQSAGVVEGGGPQGSTCCGSLEPGQPRLRASRSNT